MEVEGDGTVVLWVAHDGAARDACGGACVAVAAAGLAGCVSQGQLRSAVARLRRAGSCGLLKPA